MNLHPHPKTLFTKTSAVVWSWPGLERSAGLVIFIFLWMLLAARVSAQTLDMQFKFDDSGTTTIDSQNGVVLNLVNSSGTATDLHGAPGTGVAGVGQALDLTSASSGGNGPLAWTSSSSSVDFENLSNFTVTMWLKPQQTISGFPRFFTLGATSMTDVSSSGGLGFSPDTGSAGQLFINGGSKIVLPGFNSLFPGGQWTFLALTYDGTTNVTLFTGSESSPVGTPQKLIRTVTPPINVGAAFRVMIGNNSARSRGFDGWIDDVRFYTGTADATFVEAVRSSATNIPNPYASSPTILPTNTVYAGTLVTLSATTSGTQPITNSWQTDSGSGGATWTDLSTSNTNSYTIDTTGLANTTIEYRLAVSNALGLYAGSPATLTVLPASGPIIVSGATITPSSVPVGGSAVLSGSFAGTLPIRYQWLFTDTNGNSSLISGATSNVLTLSNIQYANAGNYSLTASNNPGGVPTVVTNTPAALTVHPAVIILTNAVAPIPSSSDIAQLDSTGDAKKPGANALNYYDNNGNAPGQTFTTGSNTNGYTLNALYYLAGGPVVSDGSHGAGVTYTLRIYSFDGSTATLLSTYVNDNVAPAVPNNTWVEWTGGLTNTFAPNSTYAYSISAGSGFMHMGNASNSPAFYNGGLCLIPKAGGAVTFATPAGTSDATFLINLVPTGSPAVQTVSLSPANSPANPVYGGQSVTLNVQDIGDSPLYYDWQTDNGSGGASFSDIPGSNTNNYTFDTTSLAPAIYNYRVIVTNNFGAATSSIVTLNLIAASAPTLTADTALTPTAVFVGNSVSMSAAFVGTPPISYQWEFDGGSGPVKIAGATNATFTLSNAQLSNNGSYSVTASNAIAPYTNSSSPLLLTVALPPATNAIGAGVIDGGNSAPPIGAYDIAQLVSVPPSLVPGINYYVDNSSPPGQTFTTGTNPPAGYAGYPLNSIWLQEELSTVGSGGNTPQTYTLGVYQLTGTNATLLTSYVSSNTLGIVEGDWIQWVGLTNVLQTNTTYAFSIHRNGIGWWKVANDGGQMTDLYTNGQVAVFPASGAGSVTYSSDPTIDAAFVVDLTPPGPPVPLQATQIKPANCYAGNPVFMQAAFSGSLPIHYQWQFWDTNGVGPIDIPGATNFVYAISSVAHSNAGTYSCMASNYVDGVPYVSNSIPATLTVPLPPSYFVSDYSYSTFNATHYSGQGAIGTGYYWNTVDTSGRNQTGFADDGFTDLSLGFTSTRTWDFAHSGGIDLLDYYMLNQGSGQTTFGLNNLPNGVYNLVVYACNGHYEYSQTAITVGGVTQNALATSDSDFVPGMNYVVFTNIVVTNGAINGIWQKAGTAESALNGVQVELGYAFENPAVNITTQPTNAVVADGQPANFSVVAYGPPPLSYQWRANGSPINGATNSTLAFSPPTAGDTLPDYDVVVSSPSSDLSTTSSVVTLTIRSSVDNLVWRGYGLKWDVSGANWWDTTTGFDPANFQQGDNILLDDSTPINQNIYLIGRIMPGSVTVANTNYTLNGPGYLSWNMSLNVTNGARLTLATPNDYSGSTVISGGSALALTGAGSIGNSSSILMGTNSTIDVTARGDGTLTLGPTQTLKGTGTFNITGALVNNGTLEFNVSKTSGVITNDRLQGLTSITYGGALKLDVNGDPLVAGDSFKLFNAGSYNGSFASIVPATPGVGLVWNASALATSGTLSVMSSVTVNTTPTNITVNVSGGDLTLTWPADHTGWRLQAQTNPVGGGLGTNWVDITGANLTNQIQGPFDPSRGSVFFRLVYP